MEQLPRIKNNQQTNITRHSTRKKWYQRRIIVPTMLLTPHCCWDKRERLYRYTTLQSHFTHEQDITKRKTPLQRKETLRKIHVSLWK